MLGIPSVLQAANELNEKKAHASADGAPAAASGAKGSNRFATPISGGEIKVANVFGSGGDSGYRWLKEWRTRCKWPAYQHLECQIKGCKETATLGGHMLAEGPGISVDNGNNYILPICARHNQNKRLDCAPMGGRCPYMTDVKRGAQLLPVLEHSVVQPKQAERYAEQGQNLRDAAPMDAASIKTISTSQVVPYLAGKARGKKGRKSFILITSESGCHHCRDFAPRYAKTAQRARDTGYYKVDLGSDWHLPLQDLRSKLRRAGFTEVADGLDGIPLVIEARPGKSPKRAELADFR